MCLLRHTISLPSGRGGSQTARKWSEIFSRGFKPIFLRKRRHFFCANFSRKKSRTVHPLFSATPSRWVFAQLFQAIATTAVGQLNLQGRDIIPALSETSSFRFDAIPAHCTLCWHIEHAQLRNFEMKKWIIFCFFSFCDFGGTTNVIF